MDTTTYPLTLPPNTVTAVSCDTPPATPAPSPPASSEAPAMRNLAAIAADIRVQQGKAAETFFEIGRLLIEAKQQLSEPRSWLQWLSNNVGLSVRTAERCMSLARGYANSTTLSNLGATKALALLAIPDNERETFIKEKHEIDKVIGTVQELSARQVQRLVKLHTCNDAVNETSRGSQPKTVSHCIETENDSLPLIKPFFRVIHPASPTRLFQHSLEMACNSLNKVNQSLQEHMDLVSLSEFHDELQTLKQAAALFLGLTAS